MMAQYIMPGTEYINGQWLDYMTIDLSPKQQLLQEPAQNDQDLVAASFLNFCP